MKPSLIDTLSRHQFIITSVIIGLFLASGAFFSINYSNSQFASITDASCYLQGEVNAMESELTNLNGQASSIQNEILQLEQSIISLSSSQTTNGYTIDTLKAEIRSDYDISQEEQRMNGICAAENSAGADYTASPDVPSCSDVTAYYNSIKSNNEYKKTLLANLEAQSGSSNMDYLTSTLSERRSTLQNLTGVQIPELTQLIGLYKTNICPKTETDAGDGSFVANIAACTDSIDNDKNGMVDCEDTACQGTSVCVVVVDAENTVEPEIDDNAGVKPDFGPLPLPAGEGGIDNPGLFPRCEVYESGLIPLDDERNVLEAERERLSQAITEMQTELDNLNPTSYTYYVEVDYYNNKLNSLNAQVASNAQALAANAAKIAALQAEIQQCLASGN